MSYYEIVITNKETYMMKKEVEVINPMQLRIPNEMKCSISDAAKRSFRTLHSEVLYRLQIADEILKKGAVNVQ